MWSDKVTPLWHVSSSHQLLSYSELHCVSDSESLAWLVREDNQKITTPLNSPSLSPTPTFPHPVQVQVKSEMALIRANPDYMYDQVTRQVIMQPTGLLIV